MRNTKSSEVKETKTMDKKKNTITIPLPSRLNVTHVLVVSLIIASFLLGALSMRLYQLEKGGTTTAAAGTGDTAVAPAVGAPAEDTSPRDVLLDDDAVLGDPDAPVTLIEFSDYECPFCKQHFTNTYAQLKTEYIDTGKVKMIFRDFPLSFHDPLATKQAIAANCAREQGDDATYYEFHDAVFTKTSSNGSGMTVDDLYAIAADMGLDAASFKECVDTDKYKDEVTKDIADGTASGASATPSFFVGKTDGDEKISGTPLIGAQPFSAFKTLIDQNLE